MQPKAYLTVGLQFGDEGKGTIVDSLVRKYNAEYVIRYSGGHQCAHNVVLPDGTHHTFRQFGSGTFAGAKTILTEDVIVDPVGLCIEAKELDSKGMVDSLDNIFVHEDCLVTLPYHVGLNRIRELSRKANPHGSCGVGIGETRNYALKFGDLAIRVKDFVISELDIHATSSVRNKLWSLHSYVLSEVEKLNIDWTDPKYDESIELINSCTKTVFDVIYARLFNVNTVSSRFIQGTVINNVTVWEAAQGTLLDEHYGFHPYTTWSTVTVHNALKYLNDVPYEKIGIFRAYTTRHGAGPLPTEDEKLNQIYPELHNGTGKFQGAFRVGHLDFTLLGYAINANGGVDSLAITHFDYIEKQQYAKIAYQYINKTLIQFSPEHFDSREEQTKELLDLKPDNIDYCSVPKEEFLGEILMEFYARIRIISRGPTHLDKTYL